MADFRATEEKIQDGKPESAKKKKKKEDGTCQKDTDGSLNGLLLAKFGIIKATT